jgi:hypothetical protein
MITRVKMRVTPELSERVQEIVFKNGGGWFTIDSKEPKKQIEETKHPYLFISTSKYLGFAKEEDSALFKNLDYTEVSPCDFIMSNGEQKWLPKVGEEVEMSNDGKKWAKLIYLGYIPTLGFRPKYGGFYIYCRPIKQTKTITIDGKNIEISQKCFKSLKEQLLQD